MKTVLISGAGIAGPTLAFWLKAAGFEPTLIERAGALRRGGYVIDFWGLGYDIAERMGLIAGINRVGYQTREMRIMDDGGGRFRFRHQGFHRSHGRALRHACAKRSVASAAGEARRRRGSHFRRGDVSLDEHCDGVRIRSKHAGERQFDLADRRRWYIPSFASLLSGRRRVQEGPWLHRGRLRGPRLPAARRGCVSDVRTTGQDGWTLYVAR